MMTLSELIIRRITPEDKDSNQPQTRTLDTPIPARSEKVHDTYEADVFNFLLKHRKVLGISRVIRFSALVLDGAIELVDGKRLAIEIKYRMNWGKACQAESQFRHFLNLKTTAAKANPVDGGLVFFEEFSGDWESRPACRLLENGWNHWYRGHSEVEGRRLDLVQLAIPTGLFKSFDYSVDIASLEEVLRECCVPT